MSTVIEASGLSKWFGEVVAVNNLAVSISTGITGILGPNGAGKTTFMKLALGLYGPSRGYIHVFGEPPRNNLGVLRRIGYCPEMDKFFDNMTGYEFVYWMARLWGMNSATARKRSEEACETVKMTSRMDDLIEEYSRGMRQRIKMAQAIATDPELLFLDEPMSGLDPEGREEMFALIRMLGEQGRTVLLSTHVLYEVERVTSSVLLLHNGCVLAQGDMRQIRTLIDEHPHAVTIQCKDPRALAARFIEDASTLNVEFANGGVTIRTSAPNEFYQSLNTLVLDGTVEVSDIACPDDNLQSVFNYLVR